jgi:hypothetical protein
VGRWEKCHDHQKLKRLSACIGVSERQISDKSRLAISRESQFPPQASRIWKGGLVCDLEDFNFLGFEIQRTRENSFRFQIGVVRGREVKVIATTIATTASLGVAVIRKTPITIECPVLHFGFQISPREIARILQSISDGLMGR